MPPRTLAVLDARIAAAAAARAVPAAPINETAPAVDQLELFA